MDAASVTAISAGSAVVGAVVLRVGQLVLNAFVTKRSEDRTDEDHSSAQWRALLDVVKQDLVKAGTDLEALRKEHLALSVRVAVQETELASCRRSLERAEREYRRMLKSGEPEQAS